MASLTDEDAAAYLHESVVQGHLREYGPLLLARFCNLRARRKTIATVLLCAEFDHLQLNLSGIVLLFVGWLAIHGSLESARCFSACHLVVLLTRKHGIHYLDTSAILTRVTSRCAN